MPGVFDQLARAALFSLSPEQAHRVAIRGLATGLVPPAEAPSPSLATRVLDLDLPTPVGLAAGFDKNAEAFQGLLRLGFGFVEIGTVTPRPQPGNPKPRMFRLEADEAIINRLGFNNDGIAAIRARLARSRGNGVVGVNIGANRDSENKTADYVAGIEAFAALAGYLAINISSPNTPGLRDLQGEGALDDLLIRLVSARDEVTNGTRATPLFLKVAPDLGEGDVERIAASVRGAGFDGMIVSNTTVAREGLKSARFRDETGGLSGPPLFRRSTALLARFRKALGPKVALIGVGGVDSAETAWAKLAAGADLVQVYTGMIYKGHGLAADINAGLARLLQDNGMPSIGEACGRETESWAAEAT